MKWEYLALIKRMNTYRDIDDIDITQEAPTTEPERQYYFIKKAKEYVRRESEKAGRPLTFATVTFGCQMYSVTKNLICMTS